MSIVRVLLAVGLGLCVSTAPGQETQVVFRADYENGNPTSGIAGLSASGPQAPDALQVDCTIARSGKCSIVSRIRMDDRYISAGAHRAESSTSKIRATLYGPGDHFRYKFSAQLDATWQPDTRDAIEMIWQFKRFGTHPDMFVAVKGTTLVWRISDKKQITLTRDLPRGEWLDFEFDVYWSTGDNGLATLRFVRNGEVKVFSHAGRNLRDGRSAGGYLKWGLYKPGQAEGRDPFPARAVHHDDVEVTRIQ